MCEKDYQCKCHTPTQDVAPSWEELFDAAIRPFNKDSELYLVPNLNKSCKFWAIENKTQDIKDFIAQIVRGANVNNDKRVSEAEKEGYSRALREVCEGIEALPKLEIDEFYDHGYHTALDDAKAVALSLIERLEKGV